MTRVDVLQIAGVALGVVALVIITWAWLAVLRARAREQAAVRSAERAREIKNEFVSMISHELRTPLTSIAGFADTLRDGWQDLPSEEVDEFLGIVSSQTQHLAELVEDLLVIPRLEAGRVPLELSEVDLSSLVHQVTNYIFPPGGGREASVAIPGGVRIYADPLRVQQVMRNLLENAHKYGGDQILVEGVPAGDSYLVVVSDNGPGVPDSLAERIFEAFEQVSKGDARSTQGIGLGLPIARNLARAMNGDVWYEPRFPTGSRFCFTVPAVSAAERETPPVEEDSASDVRELATS